MHDTIADTGPILHLHEIGRLNSLSPVSPLQFPSRVWEELRLRGLNEAKFLQLDLPFRVLPPIEDLPSTAETVRLQPADIEVFLLAQESSFEPLVLTDDLALRRLLEASGATVVGSVGLLIRAFTVGKLTREGLEQSIEALLEKSSLHLSRAFRAYVRVLVEKLA